MPEGYYAEVSRLLREAGYRYETNAKGSHEKWRDEETRRLVLVPRNLKSRHTANAILRSAGIDLKL
ncbi:type II toxin-antitoxin system HicA family toxin [Fulvimarina endophytica]|uniref:Type II toxin-antitoxin system HicA family toxin n=1 Tax=Fulvimarina endophytica TaxID=2293836 RepID=A0A371X536_9HYPH|nr:type II toxin-antitoxin system HicA family toxin [Fulvimarina endophytica]RFC64154.1 type II toxin-antitoxin system HicA family toxin [Fulvimarina endophytica]